MFYIMLCIMLMYTKKNTKTTMKKGKNASIIHIK